MQLVQADISVACYLEYTIRMNFTTVPRTWISVNRWRHDVSIHYKASASSSLTQGKSSQTHMRRQSVGEGVPFLLIVQLLWSNLKF